MRVIVVDHDSMLLETVVRALRTHFAIDTVSTKADCMDLLRQNDFDLVVACERLEDGSGLELLGQIAKRWPATLRVFAADRERLRLLQGRLAPFELFQTVAYPINPQKLLSTLLLAREAHEADADTTTIQHIVLGNDDPSQVEALPPGPPEPEPPRVRKAVTPPARTERAGTPTPARSLTPSRPVTRPAQDAASVVDSISEAAELAAAAMRSRIAPQADAVPAGRKAFVAGAGCAVVLFAIVLAAMQLRSPHQANPAPATSLAPQPHFSKEVTDLVAAVELDLEQDDFKKAEVDVRKLQTLAPDHPRLQFFLTLLDRRTRGGSVARVAAVASTAPTKPTSQRKVRSSEPAAATADTTPVAAAPPKRTDRGAAESSNTNTALAANAMLPTSSARQLSDAPPIASATSGSASTPQAPAETSGSPAPQVTRASVPPDGIPVVTAEAQLTRRVAPDYPATALRKGIQGYVDLRFTITPQGTVTNVAVVGADPTEVFDHAAAEAVRRWRYDPRTLDGRPVESQSQVRLQFKLDARSSLSH
jgi:TonB family protein